MEFLPPTDTVRVHKTFGPELLNSQGTFAAESRNNEVSSCFTVRPCAFPVLKRLIPTVLFMLLDLLTLLHTSQGSTFLFSGT